MVLKDFVRERVRKPFAMFGGYVALAAAVAAAVYFMDSRYSARLERQREVFEQRLQESREQDMGKVRGFLEKYVGVVERLEKGMGEQREKIENLSKKKYTPMEHYLALETIHNALSTAVSRMEIELEEKGILEKKQR